MNQAQTVVKKFDGSNMFDGSNKVWSGEQSWVVRTELGAANRARINLVSTRLGLIVIT